MKSDDESNVPKEIGEEREKREKKLVVSPTLKSKRPSFLIKKLKLKSKSHPQEEIKDIANLPLPSTSSDERQTPEGDDNFILTKSASETNLQETWKSAENLAKDNTKSSAKSAVTVERNQFDLSSEQKGFPERTKSLENLNDMPAYGELIMDQTAETSNANQSPNKPKDHLYKVLVIGDLGTGKTSIIKRYVHRFFSQHYRATIGVDFSLKVLNWDDQNLVRLQLWDIAGQERYGNMTRVYYKEAVGAFIVFDVTRKATFDSVANWKSDLDSKVELSDGSKIPCVLLANKTRFATTVASSVEMKIIDWATTLIYNTSRYLTQLVNSESDNSYNV
nr:ras-related protein Rab-33B-like [Leptinotarsa decemlineata]